MKNILCYGDSNTWGYDAITKERFPADVRWPGVLRQQLGEGYWVIEEGLNGRTTVWDDPVEGEWKNGLKYLTPCLESHAPLDLVVLMLGTNDLKLRYSVPPSDIASGVERLVNAVRLSPFGPQNHPPQLLLLAPPPVGRLSEFAEMFTGSVEKSQKLAFYYRQVADQYNCHFLDTSLVIASWDLDGIHLSPEDHHKLGIAVAEHIRKLEI